MLSFQFMKRCDLLLPSAIYLVSSPPVFSPTASVTGREKTMDWAGVSMPASFIMADMMALRWFFFVTMKVRSFSEALRLVHAGAPGMYHRAAVSAGAPGCIHDKIVMSLVTDYHQ